MRYISAATLFNVCDQIVEFMESPSCQQVQPRSSHVESLQWADEHCACGMFSLRQQARNVMNGAGRTAARTTVKLPEITAKHNFRPAFLQDISN